MVRIGVVSDTHLASAEDLPSKLLAALEDVDLVLHAGDMISTAVLEKLKRLSPQFKAVWGNMDQPDVKRALPEKEIIQIGQFRIGLTHGSGAPFNLRETVKKEFADQQINCIVYGHSHSPLNEIHQNILYFNPGSPTDKIFAPYNSYGILEVDKEITGRIIKI